jgi:membrane associated rhomboid family serine protease
MFVHGDFWHVAVNMLVLFLFGSELETIWGRVEFLKYYLITGIGSGLVWLLFQTFSQGSAFLIGASGAVYGILTAYGLMFPNRIVYIYFLFPIRVKWFVIILGVIAFFSSLGNHSNISHLTHLSGMVLGFIYLRFNRKWKQIVFTLRKQIVESKLKREESRQKKKHILQQDVDQILDRINQVGYDGLSDHEKTRLYAASKEISREKKKD